MSRLHGTLSSHSQSSSIDSVELFPRPLTFRRTIASQSPLVSPTPLGRCASNGSSSEISMRREFGGIRPETRGKSPSSKRHIRISTVFHPLGQFPTEFSEDVEDTHRKFEHNPFMDRLGLARVGGNRRRSSIASLSTLKIPKSFRSSNSRAGSSIYSRDTKSMSVPPSPGPAIDLSTSLQSQTEQGRTRRAASFNESFPKGFDRLLPFERDVDVPSQHNGSASSKLKEGSRPHSDRNDPQIPFFPSGQSTANIAVSDVGTASSNTFGTKMPVPKISIARSSDDVFGAGTSMATQRTDIGPETGIGRNFRSVKAIGSKWSFEDLVRYGGRTAPGGAEWF